MNLKVQLNETKAKLSDAEREIRQLRKAIELAGYTLLESEFTLRDGSTIPFFLTPTAALVD